MPAIKTNRSNLVSPHCLTRACNLGDLGGWFRAEVGSLKSPPEVHVVLNVFEALADFVRWPERAILLWPGCDRGRKYHTYPDCIRLAAKSSAVRLDSRVNGPAIAAYRLAGGVRPPRYGSSNAWSVHHLYSGKFAYLGRTTTLHAARDGHHCTQSAGLVAVHPIADQMCDEYPFFSWLLRAMAYQRFGYDPDEVFFDGTHDSNGFTGRECYVFPVGAS